ncbi:protein kinase domain-containing protein [Streptomyces sp. cmx-4-9]|uniref:serine/threonine-protein kinase n=1 Tax=Streptomyces sp. cmx-4-9 TaxID=2790941 RepID=UPI0039807785
MLELRGSGAEPLEADDPRQIGPIPLAGRLGAGGMGRVYLGVRDGRYVAVKQLLASVVGEDQDFLRRFGHELDNLARLPEGATAPLLDSDRTARPPWFATAYVPGITLKEAVDLHGGPLPRAALWLLLREASAGLAAVHALGMVHRDLKPSNAMLTSDGLTLIDFGVARAAEQSRLTRTGMVVGTPAYMAPEQASGTRRLSGATDVFALGSVLAYAACGRPPFGDESGHGVLYRIVHEEPDLGPLRELDPALAALVETCLDKDPEGRPTAAELLARATAEGPFPAPLWPAAVAARLAERAAFAAEVQQVDVPTLPLAGAAPAAASVPDPVPGADAVVAARPADARRPERRRRTRILLAVVPVVVVGGGTTLALQHLPFVQETRTEGRADPSAPAAAPGGQASPAAGGAPSGPAASAASSPPAAGESPGQGGATAGNGVPEGSGAVAAGAAGAAAAAGAAGAGGAGTGPGTGTQPGTGPGTGAGAGGGGSAGPGTGTSSAPGRPATTAPGKPPASPPPASGTYRYRNGDNGQCISQVYGSASYGACGDASTRWTVQGRSDGSFKLVNQQSGRCLYSNGLGQAVFVGDCAQDIGRVWRTGADGSLRSDYGGGCLDPYMGTGLHTLTCAGKASQRWTRQA